MENLKPASGRFAGGVHYFPVRVYFEDTDLSGIVYHANYLRFMERARSDMLRLVGIDQRAAVESGDGVYAVTHVELNYRRSAHMEDELTVVSRVGRVSAATVTIEQTIMRGEDLISNGEISVAFLSPAGRAKRQPREWVDLFNRIAQGEDICP
ncbi:MAG: YbgC/FadM family acyl-CoA thioesterase [Sphingobium sp.]